MTFLDNQVSQTNPFQSLSNSFNCLYYLVIEWLDVCCPLSDGKSWLSVGYSAITKQQQFTNFDCGVACLLYAEKCGQEQVHYFSVHVTVFQYLILMYDSHFLTAESFITSGRLWNHQKLFDSFLHLCFYFSQSKEEINNFTTQDNITEYRRTLRTFTNTMSGLCIDLIV